MSKETEKVEKLLALDEPMALYNAVLDVIRKDINVLFTAQKDLRNAFINMIPKDLLKNLYKLSEQVVAIVKEISAKKYPALNESARNFTAKYDISTYLDDFKEERIELTNDKGYFRIINCKDENTLRITLVDSHVVVIYIEGPELTDIKLDFDWVGLSFRSLNDCSEAYKFWIQDNKQLVIDSLEEIYNKIVVDLAALMNNSFNEDN